MNKSILGLLVIILTALTCKAQVDYTTAIGVRLTGDWSGITAKQKLSEKSVGEICLALPWNGFSIAGIYHIVGDIKNADNFNWHVGAGVLFTSWGTSKAHPYLDKDRRGGYIGVLGAVGVEYTFNELPINAGIDWMPTFYVLPNTLGYYGNVALTVRYVLKGNQ